MNRLEGKVALITGGASGMGEASARRFVAEGAKVVISDVQVDKGEALAAEIGAMFLQHDVADEAAWKRVMTLIAERFGRLDVVMNNAGIVEYESIEDVTMASWNRLLAINLTGVMHGCQQGIALMKKNPGGSSGSIINVSSSSGFTALPNAPAYSATKGAVRSLTQSVAVYCARAGLNIRCNAIVPAAIDTPIMSSAIATMPGIIETLKSMSPMGRMGRPEEIAAMAAFLAADESGFCNGSEYKVDGATLAAHPGL